MPFDRYGHCPFAQLQSPHTHTHTHRERRTAEWRVCETNWQRAKLGSVMPTPSPHTHTQTLQQTQQSPGCATTQFTQCVHTALNLSLAASATMKYNVTGKQGDTGPLKTLFLPPQDHSHLETQACNYTRPTAPSGAQSKASIQTPCIYYSRQRKERGDEYKANSMRVLWAWIGT